VQAVSSNALAFLDHKYKLSQYWGAVQAAQGTDGLSAWMDGLEPDRQAEIEEGLSAVYNYCLTWGVADEPAQEDRELLSVMLDREFDNPRLERLYWLRLVRLQDDDAGLVVHTVRFLTQQRAQGGAAEPKGNE